MASPSSNPDSTSETLSEHLIRPLEEEGRKATASRAAFRDNEEDFSEDGVCSEKSDDTGNQSGEDEDCSEENDDTRRHRAMIEYIIHCDRPLDTVECPYFRELIWTVNPGFVFLSKSAVVAEISNIFKTEKRKLKEALKLRRVSVSASIWRSDPNAYTEYMSWITEPDAKYMCVNAHWIDDSWSSQKRTIGFVPILDSEGDAMCEALVECFVDWGITQVHTVTMDYEISSNSTTVDVLNRKLKENGVSGLEGGVLELRCVCSVINSIVEDGLKELAPSIAKVESALMYAVSSVEANLEFKECIAAEQIESKPTLYLNDVTKWNTTYAMMDAALRYRKAFDRLAGNCGTEFEGLVDSDWKNAESSVQFLKPFYNLVTSLCIGSSAKSNFCFPYICDVKKELLVLSRDANDLMSQLAVTTAAKLVEHWGNPEKIHPVLFLATVLDPRYKISYLEYCLESMYEAEAVQKLLKNVKASLYKLFDEYTRNPAESTGLLSTFANMHVPEGRSRNEVDHYLSEHCEKIPTESFEVLAWWRDNADEYKVLSEIARDLLAVPMSSLSPNSVFSISGRVMSHNRSQLDPPMLNVMVCVKDWLASYQKPDPRDTITDDLDPILAEGPDDDGSVISEEPIEAKED